MGNSLLPIARVAAAGRYGAEKHNPFRQLHSLFQIERRGDRVWHRQTRLGPGGEEVYRFDLEANYAIGSGNHGHSYLTERDGYLYQTPVSWFSQKQIWDLSPGFGDSSLAGRPVSPNCLFCHSNPVRYDKDGINHVLRPAFPFGHAIGCERCHGPGGRHVESGDRLDVVNPRRLDWMLREAVCEQCHLEAKVRVLRRGRDLFDFRPGMPLELFWAMFVHTGGEEYKAVSHVEQMYQSTCFRRSDDAGKLGCTSCHDPHVKVGPDRRVAHYRRRCQVCHETQPCSLPLEARLHQSKEDSCIDCHMPRYPASDIAHTAATDHRILRRPAAGRRPEAATKPAGHSSEQDLVSFYRDRLAADADAPRDFGLALAMLRQGATHGEAIDRAALALLEAALRNDSGDVEGWEAKAAVLDVLDRPAEMLAAAETALEKAPRRERCLMDAARAAQAVGETDKALDYYRRAILATRTTPDTGGTWSASSPSGAPGRKWPSTPRPGCGWSRAAWTPGWPTSRPCCNCTAATKLGPNLPSSSCSGRPTSTSCAPGSPGKPARGSDPCHPFGTRAARVRRKLS
jgi:hypothetical protein